MWSEEEYLARAKRRLLESLRQSVQDERVLQAMERVPREFFVPEEYRSQAYEDIPLPIGEGQTISQPFIVALMTSALELRETDKVLEVGTGSGYQAAVLAELVPRGRVVTVERIPSLAERARERLQALGYRNVDVKVVCDTLGWPDEAPYDAIIVTAASPRVPRALLDQLGDGGRMVLPVGPMEEQELVKVVRDGDQFRMKLLGGVRFVPLIGPEAWPESPPYY